MRVIKFRQFQGRALPFHYFEFTNGMCSGVCSASLDTNPIMQFTGLLDKNGKEIYESDELKDNRGNIWIVSWNDNHACFMVTHEHVVSEVIDNENMEIVGNVYLKS